MNEAIRVVNATRYIDMGLKVLPLKKRKKVPSESGGHNKATNDKKLITKKLKAKNDCNYGVVPNVLSETEAIVVIDVDNADDLVKITKNDMGGNELPETHTVSTPNGTHYYFTYDPSKYEIRNGTKLNGYDIDIRAAGKGYVVGAGSNFVATDEEIAKGKRSGDYKIENDADPAPLSVAPVNWCEYLARAEYGKSRKEITTIDHQTQKPIDDITKELGKVADTNNNHSTPSEVSDLLNQLSPDTDNDTWMKQGMAVKHALSDYPEEAREIFEDWSSVSEKYDPKVFDKRWDSFDNRNETGGDIVTIASLYKMVNNLTESERLHNLYDNKGIVHPPIEVLFNQPANEMTDSYNAWLVAKRFGENLLYHEKLDSWYYWNGSYWAVGDMNSDRYISTLGTYYKGKASRENDEDTREAYKKWSRRCDSNTVINATKNRLKYRLAHNYKMDNRDDLFPVKNGVVNLVTGELLPPDRSFYNTAASPCKYVKSAKCPVFTSFIDQIFLGDKELIDYVQRYFGYMLSGWMNEQYMHIWKGDGRDGKGTLTKILTRVIGGYAHSTSAELVILLHKDKPGHIIAEIQGKRVLFAPETRKNEKLDEKFIKSLTGNDRMTADKKYKDAIEFQPKGKLNLQTNHLPIVRNNDYAMWERLRVIPFGLKLDKKDRDTKLENKLYAEREGVLAWLVEGAVKYQQIGDLKEIPEVMVEATEKYRDETDSIHNFMTTQLTKDDGGCGEKGTCSGNMYKAYEFYCDDTGGYPESERMFRERMKDDGGYTLRKTHDCNMWLGVYLIQYIESMDLEVTEAVSEWD